MRVLFYFYAQNLGNRVIGTLFQSLINNGWQQGSLTNTSHYFFRQGISDSDYIILSPENESNNFLNLLNRLKQNLNLQNQEIYIWLIVHHASAEVQHNRNYIGEAERNVINYTCHIPVRNSNFCLSAIKKNSVDFDTLLNACGYKNNNPHLSLKDPLIIIFTEEEYKEWEKADECKSKANAYDDNVNPMTPSNTGNTPRIIEFKTDNYTILFVKENGLNVNKGGADELLNKILNNWRKRLKKEDIYVAVHALTTYIKAKKLFEDRAHICNFHHIDDEPHRSFCNLLVEVIENINIENINRKNSREAEKICGEIIEKIKLLENISIMLEISRLVHRIAHIFLPLDIDLMGIVEVRNQESRDNKAIGYLEEVLKEKANLDTNLPKDNEGKPAYYRRKLAHLWYMIVHKKFNGQKAVSPGNNPEELLPDGKAIIDLIDDGKRKKPEVQKCWKKFLKICGLKLNNDKNDPFDNNNIILDNNSPILQFMRLLDSKIENNSIVKNDVEGILDYFKNWEIEGEKINSFHDWFCALMKCLDELKKILEEKDM